MKVAISRLHHPVHTLGPGSRVGIWFQGCSIQCPGCISADTWAEGRGITTVAAVMDVIEPWLAQADGVTISGGEPFDQPESLRTLLIRLRTATRGDVLVYSGHPWESLTEHLAACTGLIDALITDPFKIDAPQTLALRGSDNQRLHCLTPLGQERFQPYERPLTADDQRLDVHFDEDGTVWMAGIPRRGDMHRLAQALSAGGHVASTTEARPSHKRNPS
ncbi:MULTISPECIES: 4Fe-4S single cluster domain-containing protein [unclassified Corallococcus]|uniref:4Fe-4S single cluster domain-containing protein n=1 Tax=unclassified Corallococcus TaxID=2685029 RepID=UPI001A8E5DAB|nr:MULTISPECIES: 4Fe-4S single cluster domain-containing protein [unclassified Corallococcus]MBN9682277.1 radical SAM protein [Corallococcus sp. NCSPR001]WAS86167.1 4Fe-4S single cluster domain-containing protein [Corallococcus sp. NCRR]